MEPYTVNAVQAGMKLVDFLAERSSCSRRKAKTLLDQRCVFVNQQIIWMAHHTVRVGDVVEVRGGPEPKATLQLRWLHKDARLLVVDKPAGMLSVGPSSLEERVRVALGEKGVSAVHRLDRDTTGCLLFARDEETAEALKKLFRERVIHKSYRVIVHGQFPNEERTIRSQVQGEPAVTQVQPLKTGGKASLLRCYPHTGRTHQIRRHLAEQGFPVVGDREHGPKKITDPVMRMAPRQMLHAGELVFTHPHTGKTLRCRSPLPADFTALLKKLRLE